MLEHDPIYSAECSAWFAEAVAGISDTVSMVSPVQWAESHRYLPPSVTPLPGPMRYDLAPMWREVVDCMDVRSPIREVTVKKGAQILFTTSVLETAIGYAMAVVKSAPCMMVTADAELAKLRMDQYITPMIQQSGLMELIRSTDEISNRKTGKTDAKIEWSGGGFLIPFGAKNANKLRSLSIRFLYEDEIDGWPDKVGKDGDPGKLVEDRTKAYNLSRKILRGSTPLIKGGRVDRNYNAGDCRKYIVCCLACGFPQELRFQTTDAETGVRSGLVWQTEDGILVPDSVRYLCTNCQHEHLNSHKTKLFDPINGAHWHPTKKPSAPDVRSYHLSALYSPPGMYPWSAIVDDWLKAYDEDNARPRDLTLLQVFYNNNLGESFEIIGDRLRFTVVSAHRRHEYRFGDIPNNFAMTVAGGPVTILTCAVDIHGDNMAVAVIGWTRGGRAFVVDYWRFHGDTEQVDNPETWGRLATLIETKEYIADDGKRYDIALTLIDSGYRADQAYQFCSSYESGVYPIKGVDQPPKSAKVLEFSEFVSRLGTRAYNITVNIYKDRWSAALRRGWDKAGPQPLNYFNAPSDITDKQLRELTVEQRVEKTDDASGRSLGFEWKRPSGSRNELWDLLVYNNAALEMIAHAICVTEGEREFVNWSEVWDVLEQGRYYSQG